MFGAANEQPMAPVEITAADIAAYVDGRLSPRRRREIEGLLACNPDMASAVMTQLHLRGSPVARPRRLGPRWSAVLAGAAVLFGSTLGWTAAERQDLDGWRAAGGMAPPEYVEEAAEARQATRLRARMVSQIETARLDAPEVERMMRVSLPRLPRTWRIIDVQVFPTDEGPAVAVAIDAAGRRLDLFAVRAETAASEQPAIATRGRERVAYWERGDDAYVLSGPQSRRELISDAVALATGAAL